MQSMRSSPFRVSDQDYLKVHFGVWPLKIRQLLHIQHVKEHVRAHLMAARGR